MNKILRKIKQIYISLNHEKKLKEMYSRIVKENDLVFDIGANKGTHSKVFLELGAKVIAVEPNIHEMNYLKERLKNIKNLKFFRGGVGDKNEMHQFFMNKNEPAASSFLKNWRTGNLTAENVRITTLNNLIKKCGIPSYIKIDVEGYEEKVLMGLSEDNLSKIKYISIEYTPKSSNLDFIFEKIKNLKNVKFNFIPQAQYEFQFQNWVNKNELKKNIGNQVGDIFIRLRERNI